MGCGNPGLAAPRPPPGQTRPFFSRPCLETNAASHWPRETREGPPVSLRGGRSRPAQADVVNAGRLCPQAADGPTGTHSARPPGCPPAAAQFTGCPRPPGCPTTPAQYPGCRPVKAGCPRRGCPPDANNWSGSSGHARNRSGPGPQRRSAPALGRGQPGKSGQAQPAAPAAPSAPSARRRRPLRLAGRGVRLGPQTFTTFAVLMTAWLARTLVPSRGLRGQRPPIFNNSRSNSREQLLKQLLKQHLSN
jgi:hypothetical protein